MPVFDAATWEETVARNPPWDAATWTDATWTDATWTDRVESARGGPRAGYLLTPAEEAAILADPDLRPQAQD